ncbi:MAG: Rieske 2Fe-2S domain-containing protein [Acidobacteriota bacterium]
MAEFVSVARRGDIAEGQGKSFEVSGKTIALFCINGTFYAIDNTCVHRGGPLAEGQLEGTLITCPWHRWQYEVTTGACRTNPNARVSSYPVRVDGDDIQVNC